MHFRAIPATLAAYRQVLVQPFVPLRSPAVDSNTVMTRLHDVREARTERLGQVSEKQAGDEHCPSETHIVGSADGAQLSH